jgi:transcriptional regulator with XRE-family HTH domain
MPAKAENKIAAKSDTALAYQQEIKDIRLALDITQAEFGALLGVNSNAIARYERGYRKVSETTILLARQLLKQRKRARKA